MGSESAHTHAECEPIGFGRTPTQKIRTLSNSMGSKKCIGLGMGRTLPNPSCSVSGEPYGIGIGRIRVRQNLAGLTTDSEASSKRITSLPELCFPISCLLARPDLRRLPHAVRLLRPGHGAVRGRARQGQAHQGILIRVSWKKKSFFQVSTGRSSSLWKNYIP